MCTTNAYLHSNTNKYKYLYKQLYIDRRTYVKINDNRNIYTYIEHHHTKSGKIYDH